MPTTPINSPITSVIARELAKSGSPVGKTSSMQPISLPDLVRLSVSKIDMSSLQNSSSFLQQGIDPLQEHNIPTTPINSPITSVIARELAKSGSPVGKTSSIQPISLPDLVRLNVSKIDVSSSLRLSDEFFISIKKLVESDILPESESNPDSLVEDAPAAPMYGEIKEPDTEL